jgi:hypothetical protein
MKSTCCRFNRSALAITSRLSGIFVVFTCLVLFVACSKAQDSKTQTGVAASKAEIKIEAQTAEKLWEDLDPMSFTNPTNIDNEWFPLKPGTRLTWEGTTIEDDGTAVPHRVVFTVTDLTKVIAGVPTVVCWDQDYSDGELVETELVFFAQDNDGTVWHLGQYPEEYDEGKFVAAPCWLHGFEEAKAGIMMKAKPQLGTPSYSQGWAPSVDWTDRGQTYQMGQKVSVPAGSYEDVLVIDETAQSEPGAHQLKYYARGVGNIKVGWMGEGEKTKETLDLVKIEQLDAKAMAEVRSEVLKIEKRAYKNSKKVYAHTPPAEHTPQSGEGQATK